MYPTPVNDTFIEAGKALMTRALDLVLGAEKQRRFRKGLGPESHGKQAFTWTVYLFVKPLKKGKLPWLMCDLTNCFLPEASCVC